MFTKITDADLTNKGVVGLPDTPNLSTTEMQEKFDEIANDVIIPKFNNLVDEMADSSAAENIGAVDTLGNPTTVQELLSDIKTNGYTREQADEKFVAKEEGKTLTSNDFTDEDKEKLDSLENYELPIGTVETLGGVKPDNETFTIDENGVGHAIGGGGTGTADYNALINKPQINGVTLIGNKSAEDLGLQTEIKLVHITVTYETDVIGGTITCRNGAEVETFIADESLSHTFDLMSLGTWIISEDATDTSETVVADFYGNYATSLGGKVKIVVNYAEDMVGKHISVTHDGVTKTKIASGTSIVFSFKPHGEFTVGEDLNNQTKIVNATVDGTYTVDFKASINVTISDLLVGNAITCSDGATTLTWISDSAEHTFVVSKFGTWVVTNVDTGATVEVIVSDYAEYSADFGTMSWQGWLESASIPTSSFADLESVLASETTVRTLMNKHSSVDYLAEWIVSDESIGRTILNNDLCAKWINLKDYALDTLYSNSTVKAIMDEVDKYGYGEWVEIEKPSVPIMTSNTTPSGEVSASSSASGRYPWCAFSGKTMNDGDGDTFWYTGNSGDQYISYKFTSKKKVCKFSFAIIVSGDQQTVKLQGSNDGSTWVDISDIKSLSVTSANEIRRYSFEVNNNIEYQYVRLYITHNTFGIAMGELQFYAEEWQPKGNVPIMTSNNAPYGEVIYGSNLSAGGRQPYYVFDGRPSETDWNSEQNTLDENKLYIGYKFVNPTNVKRVALRVARESTYTDWYENGTFKVMASNDNSNWELLADNLTWIYNADIQYFDIENDNYYLYYKIVFKSYMYGSTGGSKGCVATLLQFYGRELKVSVPTMTSNTEPWGEVSSSGSYNSSATELKAFDKSLDSWWLSTNSSMSKWIQYKFNKPVCVKSIATVFHTHAVSSAILKASNNESDWDVLIPSYAPRYDNKWEIKDVDNDKEYIYYRMEFNTNDYVQLSELQFYGLDYSEHDERHYIYDHGVELETLTEFKMGSPTLEKRSNCLYMDSTTNVQGGYMATISFNHSLMRCVVDNEYIKGNSEELAVYNNSSLSSVISRTRPLNGLPKNYYLAISNVTGEHTALVNTVASRMTIKEWWLE